MIQTQIKDKVPKKEADRETGGTERYNMLVCICARAREYHTYIQIICNVPGVRVCWGGRGEWTPSVAPT